MLLVLTADQRYWKHSEDLLFLGEWCKLYAWKEKWSQAKSQTLPYHWDDRRRLYQDTLWLEEAYEGLLPQVAAALDSLHNTSYSCDFWRILVGPWLSSFMQTLFDRYLSILTASQSRLVSNVLIPAGSIPNWPVADSREYVERVIEDELNQHLYGELIRRSKLLRYEEIAAPAPRHSSPSSPSVRFPSVKKTTKSFVSLWARSPLAARARHVFVTSYLTPQSLFRLQWRLDQLPLPDYFGDQRLNVLQCPATRQHLHALLQKRPRSAGTESPFLTILNELMGDAIPRVFVEGFKALNELAERIFPPRPRTIFTANAHILNETFKVWAGKKKEEGASLILSQHGGHSGTGLWCLEEKHEIRIANRYVSWGWSGPNVVPLSAGKLSKLRVKPKRNGKILLVLNSFPRYFYRSYSIPIAGQSLSYLQDQYAFWIALDEEARSLVELRPYPAKFGWDECNRLRDLDPSIAIPSRIPHFDRHLRQSRLFVGTHNTTTYMEALCANFPTIIFWNPEHWELRPEAKPYFDELQEAEILFYRPEEAAKKVSSIYKEPLLWWSSNCVQSARRKFCKQFGNQQPDWLDFWASAIRAIGERTIPANTTG